MTGFREDLTRQVISAAIEVHSTLGPGSLESIYQKAFEVKLRLRGIPFKRERNPGIDTYLLSFPGFLGS